MTSRSLGGPCFLKRTDRHSPFRTERTSVGAASCVNCTKNIEQQLIAKRTDDSLPRACFSIIYVLSVALYNFVIPCVIKPRISLTLRTSTGLGQSGLLAGSKFMSLLCDSTH